MEKRLGAHQHNLPADRSSFIGREHEVIEAKRLLATTRLLTLIGVGGSGKTRLALKVAKDLTSAYPDGVWLVELAPLSEEALVPQAVAAVLGVSEQQNLPLTDTLRHSLATKNLLLVLDNCEHLIDACARFADAMLGSCPHLRILATSREALSTGGEVSCRVPSLSLPEPGRLPSVAALGQYEAVKLFVERTRFRSPTFELTPANVEAVVEICRQLDGIPLAIELATARATVLTAEQLAERLKDPLNLLTVGVRTATPRHQTLRATLRWSYELLSEPERKLFGRLSVFAGGWTLEAAEAVGAGEGIEKGEVLDLLSRLADKSLVVAEAGPEGMARYGMLEPVRQYGRERLKEGGEAEAVASRHAAFFLALAEQAAPELKGPRQVSWLKRLEKEQDNLRAAVRWLLEEGESETAARFGWALWLFWWIRGRFAEGRRWMEEALAKGSAMPTSARARALFVAGTMACGQADYRPASSMLENSLSLFRELEDDLGAAYALSSAGFAAIGQGQYEEGISLLEEAVDLSLDVGEKWGAAYMLNFLAVIQRNQGDVARAKRLAEQGLALSREVGDREGTSMALYILAELAQASSEHERARGLFEEGLELSAEVGDGTNVAYCLEGLAAVSYEKEREVARAARLWGAAEALLEKIEAAAYIYAPDRSLYRDRVSAARGALGGEAFAAAWARGRAMTLREAVAYALDEAPSAEPAPSHSVGSAPAEAKAGPELRVFALGEAWVEREGRPLVSSDWTYAKSRELLFYLLTHPDRTKEQIGLALWPDASPQQLRSSFHSALHHLRRALGGAKWVIFENGRYAFDRSLSYWLDVEAFESRLEEARRLRSEAPEGAIRSLEEAVRLYRGVFLESCADAEWVSERREELQRVYLKALLDLGELLFEGGRYAEAVDAHRKAVAHDPYSEAAHRGLMRCYAASGERGAALLHYRRLVEMLRDELGSPPAPATTALFERLRRGEDVSKGR